MSNQPGYHVRVTRRGPPPTPFGWEIYRDGASVPIERPARTFRTRVEALLDSVPVVASLALVPLIDTTTVVSSDERYGVVADREHRAPPAARLDFDAAVPFIAKCVPQAAKVWNYLQRANEK